MNIDTHSAPRPRAFHLASQDLGVLVGFDGSTQSLLALHYGALEAQRSRRELTVITAVSGPIPVYTTLGALPQKSETQAAVDAAGIVLNDARRYLQAYPGRVTYRVEQGNTAAVLAELSTAAELAILGARGRGGLLGTILGSVASTLPVHSHCPTVVVPRQYAIHVAEGSARFAPQADPRPVTVGIDGSSHSRVAALHAARAAQDRGVPLHLLMTLPSLEGWLDWYPDLDPLDQDTISRRQSQLESSLQAEAAWLRSHFPGLATTTSVKPGDPVARLSTSTHEAQLTVVGTRGRGPLSGKLLGSVSRGVLLRAAGPVMVVPDLQDERLSDQPGPIR
ncbi:universal stress protein [Nesterenkonia sp. E16_7]|uniref:universal stress protein n=1 Tax=unclassified Nesterenkonia TaxID=2629769 RepID=UPI001A92DB4F|nr:MULTISPECIES: universal stress protein [unclassified Nesterenkonia]MBO0596490.1 universal stress protein [Nesterenkonia sp. E16_10]MBO0597836.1 universal stress protein [Nesterenkonia sp. E16_7]